VADLVDPYVTKDTARAAAMRLAGWLRDHPGRWAMFAEGEMGIDPKLVQELGFEVSQKTGKLSRIRRAYARLPHPEGESLDDAIARSKRTLTLDAEVLPDLAKDSFNWTEEELQAAVQAAREKLFPVRAGRGSGRKG
jgi:hypothetical protein